MGPGRCEHALNSDGEGPAATGQVKELGRVWCPFSHSQVKRSSVSTSVSMKPGALETVTERGDPEEDTCHVVIDAPGI